MKLLYKDNVYLKECTAKVINNNPLIFDQTICFPEGGGQPSDHAELVSYGNIIDVQEVDGNIIHTLDSDKLPEIGETVTIKLDWERRFLNMQRHCGEHILSAAFFELFGGINKGFHMGENLMTIDIAFENKNITDEDISEVELLSNEMIYQNLPVTTMHFKNKKEAAKTPLRKPLTIEEDITIVAVGDKQSGAAACCGTHPLTTAEVGIIKIYKWEKYKGMYRITFDAGKPAFLKIRDDCEVLKSLCRKYSVEPENLLERLNDQDKKTNSIKQELNSFKNIYMDDLLAKFYEKNKDEKHLAIESYEHLMLSDLNRMQKNLKSDIDLIVLISTAESSAVLTGNGKVNCGQLVKEIASLMSAKGGGKDTFAQATFKNADDLDVFINYLKKAHGQNA